MTILPTTDQVPHIDPQAITQLMQLLLNNTCPKITFEEWARRWLDVYQQGRVKDNTYDGTYQEPVELHLIPWFGERIMAEIMPIDIAAYFKAAGQRYALETLKKDRMCLKNIFDTAIDNGICTRNPVTNNIKLSSKVPPRIKHTWTQEQYDIAWEFAKQYHYLDVMVLMETAMTRSELLGLTWSDFDAARQELTINNGLVQMRQSTTGRIVLAHDGLKNQYRHRTIPISAELTQRLIRLPRRLYVGGDARRHTPPRVVEPEYIICAPQGGPYQPTNWYHRRFCCFMQELSAKNPCMIKLTPHELRHTRATLLKDQGADIYSIAKLLGHSNLDMLSKRYPVFRHGRPCRRQLRPRTQRGSPKRASAA